jgi:hypothetical protein
MQNALSYNKLVSQREDLEWEDLEWEDLGSIHLGPSLTIRL